MKFRNFIYGLVIMELAMARAEAEREQLKTRTGQAEPEPAELLLFMNLPKLGFLQSSF